MQPAPRQAAPDSYAAMCALSPEDRIALHLTTRPAICDVGQITPAMKRVLERRIREGTWFKYRGFWNTLSPHIGLGNPKTIYAPVTTVGGVA